ncbi:MAG: amidohydrolase family protein [Anaerolineae bacterium]
MRIIDCHAHLGYDHVFDHDFSSSELIETYDALGVEGAIVQPALCRPYLDDVRAYHDAIAELCAAHPGRFWGMASITPHFRPGDLRQELTRCIRDLGFVGIKLTPIGHACSPSSRDGLALFALAEELGVPLMVHTGAGVPFSAPVQLIPGVERHPGVRVIMAHAGGELYMSETMLLVRYPNVYFEPSWLGSQSTARLLTAAGPDRLLLSSDHASNLTTELAKYRSMAEGPALERILGLNAIGLFGLPARDDVWEE